MPLQFNPSPASLPASDPGSESLENQAAHTPTPTPGRYRPALHGTPKDFARHPDFVAFGEHVRRLTDTLKAHIPHRTTACDSIDAFRDHVLEVDAQGVNRYFGPHAAGIYELGIESLERLSSVVNDPRIPPPLLRAELEDLSHHITKCPVAVVEGLEACLRRLAPPPQRLAAKWADTQRRIIEVVADEAVTTGEALRLQHAPGDHIHLVHSLLRFLQAKVGIEWPMAHDPMPSSVSPGVAGQAWIQAEDRLSPSAVAELLAEEYLGRLSERLHPPGGSRSMITMERIDHAIDELAAEYGIKPSASAVMNVDLDTGACEASGDPTLLALHFLRAKHTSGGRQTTLAPHRVVPLPSGAAIHQAWHLFWTVEDGAARPLGVDDLQALAPGALPPAAAARAIRNSTAEALVKTFDFRGLKNGEMAEALCDRLDDAQLGSMVERFQEPNEQNLSSLLHLRDALSQRDRRALFTGQEGWWLRLGQSRAKTAGEFLRRMAATPDREGLILSARSLVKEALTLTPAERRVLEPLAKDARGRNAQALRLTQPVSNFGLALKVICDALFQDNITAAEASAILDMKDVPVHDLSRALLDSVQDALTKMMRTNQSLNSVQCEVEIEPSPQGSKLRLHLTIPKPEADAAPVIAAE